jgi:hypothetical protein
MNDRRTNLVLDVAIEWTSDAANFVGGPLKNRIDRLEVPAGFEQGERGQQVRGQRKRGPGRQTTSQQISLAMNFLPRTSARLSENRVSEFFMSEPLLRKNRRAGSITIRSAADEDSSGGRLARRFHANQGSTKLVDRPLNRGSLTTVSFGSETIATEDFDSAS